MMPVISDTVVSCLESGRLISVAGIKEFTGQGEMVLDGDEVLCVDAIIWCTGYMADFGFLDPRVDPTKESPAAWNEVQGSRDRPLPRLYRAVVDGVSSPHVYRLFETGKRKKRWDGVAEEIVGVNERRREMDTGEKGEETWLLFWRPLRWGGGAGRDTA